MPSMCEISNKGIRTEFGVDFSILLVVLLVKSRPYLPPRLELVQIQSNRLMPWQQLYANFTVSL